MARFRSYLLLKFFIIC